MATPGEQNILRGPGGLLLQVWKADELRHPVSFTVDGNFVPNNLDLGMPNFTVITGPNMGGKSTLIRQVFLPL